ncbi:Deleted in lung and esophageal cancer protein 1 [Trichoplax sp. H2]|nr:Deleted in lung and esophageal cancer protein 1 [Trichoplax sp. H2]|eukprot:RDD40948.1 Deleted in lung and esophageal cancer protein 1 [Trichoplax sp. H2]
MFHSTESVKSADIQHEPTMLLQRPSSARRQNVAHILTSMFGEYFVRDTIPQDVVKYLTTSRSGDDPYHDYYVEELSKIQDEREKRLAAASSVENHLLQAKGAATLADEKRLANLTEECQTYNQIGLPSFESKFKSLLNSELLKKHHLIAPEDYSTAEAAKVEPPTAPKIPGYAQATRAYLGQTKSAESSNRNRPESAPSSRATAMEEQSLFNQKKLTTTSPLWKEGMEILDRENHKFYLSSMHKRVDHLKNPRHIPPVEGRFHQQSNIEFASRPTGNSLYSLTNQTEIFVAEPNPVVFGNYNPGKAYKMRVQIKNVTSASRHIRMIPPSTSYFASSLGQFPSENSFIAPGLACQVEITFTPDSLADYDDEIIVKSQNGLVLAIPLQGRRPPPVLSLTATLDCGHCLVNGEKVTTFKCSNSGGPGRFCIMPESSWPVKQFDNFKKPTKLDMAPFQLEPNYFELNHGESITITVKFVPEDVDIYTRNIIAICDNCHVKIFTLKGVCQTAGVEFVSVSEGLLDPLALEMYDISAQQHISFDTIHPGMLCERKLIVHNTTRVDLPYHWEFFKSILCKPGANNGHQDRFERYRVPNNQKAFSVEPSVGIFPPFAKAEFVLTYTPQHVGKFDQVLHLILEEYEENQSVADYDEVVHDIIPGLEIELRANCMAFQVELTPSVIIISDQLLIGSSWHKTVQIINNGFHPIEYEWKNQSNDNYSINISPYKDNIPSGQVRELTVEVCGYFPGKIEALIHCHIEHVETPVYLHIQAQVQGPQLNIDIPDLNYGLVRLGESVEKEIPIYNTTDAISKWEIFECQGENQNNNVATNDLLEFIFSPSNGELQPKSSTIIKALFKPTFCRRLRTVFELHAINGNRKHLHVRGEIQSPVVALTECNLQLDEVYIGLPRKSQVTLKNQTLLPTNYKWKTDDIGKKCTLTFDASEGDIGSRQAININLTLICHEMGKQEFTVPCNITGMNDPVILKIKVNVKGLTVGYSTPLMDVANIKRQTQQQLEINESKSLDLNFGTDVAIGTNAKRYLVIRNKSAIQTEYNIRVTYFIAANANLDRGVYANKSSSKVESKTGSILKRTANLADPQSKSIERAHAAYSAAILGEGRGTAFEILPSSGILDAFETKIITITAFTDMWGDYEDNLICSIKGLNDIVIPVQLGVIGCPLKFQIGNVEKKGHPIVRFGAHISASPPVSRTLRINNSSPLDIRLDWKTFNLIKGDQQVVDLLIHYGQPLPLNIPDSDNVKSVSYRQESLIPMSETSSVVSVDENRDARESIVNEEDNMNCKSFISVTVDAHGGKLADDPYRVNPAQLIVPSRGHTSINVTFKPLHSCQEDTDCYSYALGYMSLDQPDASIEGKVRRLQGYEIPPLRFDMTGSVLAAWLEVHSTDDDGNYFTAASSDLLLSNGQVLKETWKDEHFSFTNLTDTPLNFQIILSWPFEIRASQTKITSTAASANRNISKKGETSAIVRTKDQYTLLPQTNMQTNIGFCLSLDMLHRFQELEKDKDNNIVSIVTDGENKKLCFNGDLQIKFSNGTVQNVSLSASVALPTFKLAENSLDFGICFVGQIRSKLITITNPTMSGTYWISNVEAQDEASKGIFTVEPSQGYIEANITHITTNAVTIKVNFTARHNIKYTSKICINGLLGETSQILFVTGEGSYDGKYESIIH